MNKAASSIQFELNRKRSIQINIESNHCMWSIYLMKKNVFINVLSNITKNNYAFKFTRKQLINKLIFVVI